MRYQKFVVYFLSAILISACDYWPRELQSLADSIGRELPGETTAMLLGGDVVVISVTNSPLFFEASVELEALASEIASKAIVGAGVSLESISITFFEGEISEEADKQREFFFLIKDNQAVLQPIFNFDTTGPITLAEFEVFIANVETPLGEEQQKCIFKEVETRSQAIGDPETLDPTTVEFYPLNNGHCWTGWASALY